MNASCIICADMFTPKSEIYSTACGHLFHNQCLVQWIERSKTCPQCRHKETEFTIHRIYLNIASSEGIADDACTLQAKIDTVTYEISLKDKDIAKYTKKYKECKTKCTSMRETIVEMELQAREHESAMLAMKHQLANYQEKMRDKDKHTAEIAKLKKQLEGMDHMKSVINKCQDQVEKMLRNNSDPETLSVLIISLKTQLEEIKKQNQSCSSQLNAIGREMIHNNSTICKIKQRNETMQNDLVSHENCSSEMKYLREKIKETKSRLPIHHSTIVSTSPVQESSTITSGSDSIIVLDSTSSPSTSALNESSQQHTSELSSATQSTDVSNMSTPSRIISTFQSLTQRLRPATGPNVNATSGSSTAPSESKETTDASPTKTNIALKRIKSSSSFTSCSKYRKLGPGKSRRPS